MGKIIEEVKKILADRQVFVKAYFPPQDALIFQSELAYQICQLFDKGWLPPEEVKRILLITLEEIIRDLSAILRDADDTRTLERALVDYVKTLIKTGRE